MIDSLNPFDLTVVTNYGFSGHETVTKMKEALQTSNKKLNLSYHVALDIFFILNSKDVSNAEMQTILSKQKYGMWRPIVVADSEAKGIPKTNKIVILKNMSNFKMNEK